ncbi:MAG: type IX secretion system outer membrane channel protein PorV [Paludibacteraceae bacterium]|nr:type IX secretion system outer membrane channel protein PorV [Paludibacteraceae bacterium]
MKRIKVSLAGTAMMLSVLSVNAESKGDYFNPLQTAIPSLSIAPDARGGGMGDVGAATSADIYSQYWNPSKYATMDGKGGIAISYTPWLREIVNDINLAYLAGYYKLDDKQALSASLRYFSYGEINLTDMPGPSGEVISQGTAKPYELAIDAAYSRALSQYWNASVALRFIFSDLMNGVVDEETYSAAKSVAADISAFYSRPFDLSDKRVAKLNIGTNISNIGAKVSYDDGVTEQYIPTNWRLGINYEFPIDVYNKFSVSFDLNKLLVPTTPLESDYETREEYEDALEKYRSYGSIKGIFKSFGDSGGFGKEMKEVTWSLGAEYSYRDMFMARFGYFHENETNGNRKYFAAGIGFKMRVFEINAAYLIASRSSTHCPLDGTLRFSLGFNFDGMKKLVDNSNSSEE